jgi:hypothetical protein
MAVSLLTQPRTKTASFIAREGGVGLVGERTRYFRLGHARGGRGTGTGNVQVFL